MSKKAVRSRESFIKNWTAAITGSLVLVSTQSAQAHEHGAFSDFRANNPGMEKHDLRSAFRQQFAPAGGLTIQPVSNSPATNSVDVPSVRTHHQINTNSISNVSKQVNANGNAVTVSRGVDLDLTSAAANITLGAKLFGNTSSIEIQVGGQTKTLSAGSQVTAAEYIAAKQVLAGLGQKVTIGSNGSATGGSVDLSAITGKGDVLRASDLTVAAGVTTTGDFSRSSEFRLLGDLTNDGTILATNSTGQGGGTIHAADIVNNAGGAISSTVDLKLQADGSLSNYGNISSQGNLTLNAANVTNRGNVSSAKDVTINALPNTALTVDGTGGTISAANNINVNSGAAGATLTGGDYLSQNLNLNAGTGTITGNVGNVTGVVNSIGNAVHFQSAAQTLNLGAIDLNDPTFYNIGNINFTGSVTTNGADLSVIATGDITESVVGTFNINTVGAGNGGNISLIAGANITGTSAGTSSSLTGGPPNNGGTPSDVTFNQGSISGGSVLLGNAQINSSGTAGGNGGNVLIAAFGGTSATSGVVNLANGGVSTGSNITTSGNGAGSNGNLTVIAPNGIDLNAGGTGSVITTTGGTGGNGLVLVVTAQPASAGPVTYLANGSLSTAGLVADNTTTDGKVDINTINASGGITLVSGNSMTVQGSLTTTDAFQSIRLLAGLNISTGMPVNNAATLTLNDNVTATANIQIGTADNFTQNNASNLNANGIIIFVGTTNPSAPGGADYAQNGSITSTNFVDIHVGDGYVIGNSPSDTITAVSNVDISAGVVSGVGNIIQNAAIVAGTAARGDIFISATGNYKANSGNADLTAGQVTGNGDVEITAGNVQTVAGTNIIGNDVFLTANSTSGGQFQLTGNVLANKLVGTTPAGIISLTQNGSNAQDIADANVPGGLNAQQITFANNTTGNIRIQNNATPIDFKDVTASANGNVTLIEPIGSGRDGNINFTGTSVANGGTFTVLADGNITGSAGSSIGGLTGDIRSNNGSIGVDATHRLTVDFTDIRVQTLGVPSATVGNAFLFAPNNLNFAGANSQVTGTLDVVANGNLTTNSSTTVLANSATLVSNTGNIGAGVFSPFNIDTGSTAGSGVSATSTLGDVALFDPNSARINGGSAFGLFSFATGTGDLNVTASSAINANSIILSAGNNLNLEANAAVTATATAAFAATNNITAGLGSKLTADSLNVDIGGTGTVNTNINTLTTSGGTGSLTINEDDGVDLNGQANLASLTVNASELAKGDIYTNNDFSVGNLTLTNGLGGNIFVLSNVTGTTGVNLDTSAGSGSINTNGIGSIISPSISLNTAAGNIDAAVNGVAGASTSVTAQSSGGGDVGLDYSGTGTITLGGSSGNGNFTVQSSDPAGSIAIGGDISGSKVLDLTTNSLSFTGAFNASFDSVTVQSLAASGLTLDGGGVGAGGTFTTTVGGAGVTLTATDGDFIANNKTNFVGGDLFVTLANNNGINAFTVNGILNGDAIIAPPANAITIKAALITGNSLANITNFSTITVLGNTIQNSAGDVTLPTNLTFHGQNLAIIASGNVNAGSNVLIDLDSTTGNGGDLTVLAGFANSPPTVGQITTQNPVTITGFSTTGGSINLSGVDINTSSTAGTGNAGNVVLIAASAAGFVNAGTVTVHNITATASGGAGGTVLVGGFAGVTVNNIDTTGSTTSGDVGLAVGTVTISGTPVYTNGVSSGGTFVPAALAAGSLTYGNITAGAYQTGGDVVLAGAFTGTDTASGGKVTSGHIEVFQGAGTVTINSNTGEVQADATAAAGGTLNVNNDSNLNVDHITGSNLNVNITALNSTDLNLIGAINAGTGAVNLTANNITTLATGKVVADSLQLDVAGTATVNTNINTLSTVTGTGSVTINEDDGVDLGAIAANTSLTVNASQVTGGTVHTLNDFSVGTLTINNGGGDIVINNQVTGTTSVSLSTFSGTGGINGSGTVLSPSISLISSNGDIAIKVDGIADASTDVVAQGAAGGNVNLTYLGTGTISLEGSIGNGNYTVATTALNNGAIAINGDLVGGGSLSLTTDTLSFTGPVGTTVQFADVSVQSFAGGGGLTVNGGANQGTFTTTTGGAGTTFTATDGSLTTNGQLNFNGGDVFATLSVNNGTNSITNNGVLNGDGAFSGDPSANSLTLTAALITMGTIQNFNNVNLLQGNTIVNNTGDVVLPTNLTFHGESLAIIASGNVTATGATLIDLSSATGDGGTLTVIAGVTSTGSAAGQQQTTLPITITGFSTTGGNVNLSGVNIITSSTSGSGGNVEILAASGTGVGFTNAGTVTVGNVTATGTVNGGTVKIGSFSDTTVGIVTTTGGTGTGGNVGIGVATATINGTPVFTNGVHSGGTITAAALAAGTVVYGSINAGTGNVSLGGALASGNTIGSNSGGTITANNLQLDVGAGTATVTTTVNGLAANASSAAGGTITVTQASTNLAVNAVTGTDLNLTVNNATATTDIAGAVALGTGTLALTGVDVTQSTGTITAANLGLTLTGDATLTTTIGTLINSSANNLTIMNTGALTVNHITSTGLINIQNTGNLTVAAGSNIQGVDSITLQTLGSVPGTINIAAGATIATAGGVKSTAGEGNVSIIQGAAPTRSRSLKGRNITVVLSNGGTVVTGKGRGSRKITALAPTNTLTGNDAQLLLKGQTKNGLTLGGGVTITADPPLPAGAQTFLQTAPTVNHTDTTELAPTIASTGASSILAPINTVTTLTSAPAINLNNTVANSLSNLATANTNLTDLSEQEDDSYITTYAPMGQIVDGNVCSDMEFGFTTGGATAGNGSGNGIATMKHSDCVTLDSGSALFVPSKDMTVVTPKGSVKLGANSVAFVSVDSNQLSVYDINDSHKSSVVVSTGGHELALSPGRHLSVTTNSKASSFADVNPIESILHRSVNRQELGAGKKAFITEFSIPSAMSVVKPLKAMMMASNDVAAKKVANRVLKTTAVVMAIGGQAPYDYHAKPRTVALNWK